MTNDIVQLELSQREGIKTDNKRNVVRLQKHSLDGTRVEAKRKRVSTRGRERERGASYKHKAKNTRYKQQNTVIWTKHEMS